MEHTQKTAATCTSSTPIPAVSSNSSSSSASAYSRSPARSPPATAVAGTGACVCADNPATAVAGTGAVAGVGVDNPVAAVVLSPCAACKILRRRCVEKCVLAPYFPPTDPMKFTIAHKVFGASNIIKMLQELPDHQRADAIHSMVYEANARIRDPIYGCAGSIFQLQNQIQDLQSQLAKAKAEMLNMQCQNDYLVSMICMAPQKEEIISQNHPCENNSMLLDDGNLYDAWEPLWA